MSSPWVVALVILASLEGGATSWQVRQEDAGSDAPERAIAFVGNEDGFELSVERLAGGRGARCSLALPADVPGARMEALPALEVDRSEPQQVARWEPAQAWDDGGDFVEALRRDMGFVPLVRLEERNVLFDCWLPLPGQTSPSRGVVRQLLDGRELTVRFDPADGEPLETTFSLDGARQALTEALGIPGDPGRNDVLQDELLAFRVRYREATCYLLNGRKRQKRCLEAVETCRGQRHESVLSMLGCIEGE